MVCYQFAIKLKPCHAPSPPSLPLQPLLDHPQRPHLPAGSDKGGRGDLAIGGQSGGMAWFDRLAIEGQSWHGLIGWRLRVNHGMV